MGKDPLASAALFVGGAILLTITIAVGAVVILPVAAVLVVGWLVYKGVQASQKSKELEIRDAELKLAVADPHIAPDAETFTQNVLKTLISERKKNDQCLPAVQIVFAMAVATERIYEAEDLAPRTLTPASNDAMDLARWRDEMKRRVERANDTTLITKVDAVIRESFNRLADALPPAATLTTPEFNTALDLQPTDDIRVSLVDVIQNIGRAVEDMLSAFYSQEAIASKLFVDLRLQLDRNMHELSGVPYTDQHKGSTKLILPHEHKGTPEEIVSGYLKHTPFMEIFDSQVPFSPPNETRFEHSWLCAGSGHGKTNAISTMIGSDLEEVANGGCSIIVMDSQNQLIPTIANLHVFAPGQPLHGKLVHIDPSDIEYPVQLNLFAIGKERLNSYSMLERERLLNSVIELYDFVLSSLLGSEMTARQGTLFRFSTQLMMVIPDATIHTFRQLMQPGGYDKYKPYIDQLSGTAKEFFETQFNGKIFEQTKQQVVARLFTICENRTFERLFTHPKSKLDLYSEMNAGKVILINTAKDLLKQQGTEVFGRFFLALIGQAAQERATLADKKPVYCYIDEAQDYIAADSNFTVILEQARKQKIGMIVAHQYLTQLSQRTLDSLYANTSIKYAGGVSDKDAYSLARNMATEPTFIMRQGKGTFATYVRNYTKNAVALKFPLSKLPQQPHMTADEQATVRAAIRTRYAVPLSEVEVAGTKPAPPSADEPKEFADRY